jgi:hypothetical protein
LVAGCVGRPPGEGSLYIAPHRDEYACDVTVYFNEAGDVCFEGERPEDRDVEGTLWERWSGDPSGPLEMALHHPARQREVMEELRCGVCRGEPDRDHRGMLWLLHADGSVEDLSFPTDIMTATPPVCRRDARRALRACERLQEGFVTVRVREAEIVGVRGTVYSPTAPPEIDREVRLDEPAIRQVVARQLMRELRNVELDEDTLSSPNLRGREKLTLAGPVSASVWG